MGLFGSIKKKKQESALLSFLNTADDAYMKSYVNKDVRYITKYAEEGVCQQIHNDLMGDTVLLFGTAKSRIRTWTVLSSNDGTFIVKKEITQKDIQVTKGLKIAMGDEITETWDVVATGDSFLVSNIEREVTTHGFGY